MCTVVASTCDSSVMQLLLKRVEKCLLKRQVTDFPCSVLVGSPVKVKCLGYPKESDFPNLTLWPVVKTIFPLRRRRSNSDCLQVT